MDDDRAMAAGEDPRASEHDPGFDPIVRIEQASLGPDAQVRLTVSGVEDLERLRSAWASSGATVNRSADRLHAITTVQALARAAGRAFGAQRAGRMEDTLRRAIAAWADPAPALTLGTATLVTDRRPLLMGVVNVTPDSFSDGGLLYPGNHPEAAVEHGRRLVAEGADLLDVGGESTRPGSEPVEVDEELRRVLPVVRQLSAEGAMTSIDTTKPAVAEAALHAGAAVVNDVSGAADERLLAVAAAHEAGYVLMHTRGRPADMQSRTDYDDVVAEVFEFLNAGVRRCAGAGIPARRLLVDPGLGFAKTSAHNLRLLRHLRQFRALGCPVLVGPSRKSFLGSLLGADDAGDRLEGSLACAAAAIAEGASVLRVHDVGQTRRVAVVARAIASGDTDWPPVRR